MKSILLLIIGDAINQIKDILISTALMFSGMFQKKIEIKQLYPV